MNYQLRYYYSFKDFNNKEFRVEIYEDSSATIIAEEVRGGNNPFTVNYPKIENLFQQVRASGADFNIVSAENMQFVLMATGDMFKYMIKLIEIVFITPLYTQEFTRWLGYLNPDIYEEPFDRLNNYIVSFTANDGFALLDRINYNSDSDGSRINAIGSNWITIFNTFFRMGLPYNKLYVGLSSTIPNVTIDNDKTIFHYLHTNPDNFYNEDGEPETYRTVLEKILEPLGAYIFAYNGDIYITDYNHLLTASGSTASFNVYDLQNALEYLYTDELDILIGDLSNIGFRSSKQNYSIIPAINKQVVAYNRYRLTSPFSYSASEDKFGSQSSSTNLGDNLYGYNIKTYQDSNYWNAYNFSNFIKFTGTGSENKNKTESGCKFAQRTDGFHISPDHLSFTTKTDLPYFIDTNNYKLKLEVTLHPHSSLNFGLPPNPDDITDDKNIELIKLNCEIIIDNELGIKKKYYDPYYIMTSGSSDVWVPVSGSTPDYYVTFFKPTKYKLIKDDNWNFEWEHTALNDQDVELKVWRKSAKAYEDEAGNIIRDMYDLPFEIPLDSGISGRLIINLYDYELRFKNPKLPGQYVAGTQSFFQLYLKELKGTIVDQYGNEVKKLDFELVGDSTNSPLLSYYKNEGSSIKLFCGTNADKFPTENGNLLLKSAESYIPLETITRAGLTAAIENLLMRSIISNYKDNRVELSMDVNKLDSILGFLTYNNYLAGKKFTVTGIKRDYAYSTDSITIAETLPDNITINQLYN